MKVRINKGGFLEIRRGNAFRQVICPFKKDWCGDWCALFGEPIRVNEANPYSATKKRLRLCHKTLEVYSRDFEDERNSS